MENNDKTDFKAIIPQISSLGDVLRKADEVLEYLKKATKVVGWYAHPHEVRGPYNRWFTVSDVGPEYQEYVGTKQDDIKYVAACMNYAPVLALEVKRLRAALERVASQPDRPTGKWAKFDSKRFAEKILSQYGPIEVKIVFPEEE